MDERDRLLPIDEAATLLALRVSTLRKMVLMRQIPVVRITGKRAVRFRLSDLQSLIEMRRSPAVADDRRAG
jgi:excisionase family DNA binding protein